LNTNHLKPISEAKKETGEIYIDKDGRHTVYVNAKGRLFIIGKSKKTGKETRKYLTV